MRRTASGIVLGVTVSGDGYPLERNTQRWTASVCQPAARGDQLTQAVGANTARLHSIPYRLGAGELGK